MKRESGSVIYVYSGRWTRDRRLCIFTLCYQITADPHCQGKSLHPFPFLKCIVCISFNAFELKVTEINHV